MKAEVVALVAGIVGGIGVLCFFVAFATDYWLLASDDCGGNGYLHSTVSPTVVELLPSTPPSTMQLNTTPSNTIQTNGAQSNSTQSNSTESNSPEIGSPESSSTEAGGGTESPAEGVAQRLEDSVTVGPALPAVTFHHEGFFWKCWFQGDPSFHVVWAVLFTNQPAPKFCIHGYLFPLPVAVGPVPHPSYDATAVYRGFWTILVILAIAASVIGVFLLVCAVPFVSYKLYKAGGGFLLAAACLFLAQVCLFVIWKELGAIRKYILQERGEFCPEAHLEAYYGWSFMVAAAGIPLVLLSGLLFYLIGRALQRRK